jgi:hypothetical protein
MGRRTVPGWLKRALLPVWNGGHRIAWRLGEYAGAVRHRRFERCDACGRFGPMLYRRRVVPPRLEALWGLSPVLAEALARKESCECWACGAKLRARRLARVLLERYPVSEPPRPARSVRDWARSPETQALRIAEINRIEGLHEALRGLPGLAYSEYLEGVPSGTVLNGVRCESLAKLSYANESLDLVLTSETLEHVPDLEIALAEIRRVLRPGGRHLFTVPLLPGVPRTYRRTDRICHPGGDTGYPVVTEFGADLPEILHRAGFDAIEHFGPVAETDLAQVWETTKRDDRP